MLSPNIFLIVLDFQNRGKVPVLVLYTVKSIKLTWLSLFWYKSNKLSPKNVKVLLSGYTRSPDWLASTMLDVVIVWFKSCSGMFMFKNAVQNQVRPLTTPIN